MTSRFEMGCKRHDVLTPLVSARLHKGSSATKCMAGFRRSILITATRKATEWNHIMTMAGEFLGRQAFETPCENLVYRIEHAPPLASTSTK